jgi:hypothetical protein
MPPVAIPSAANPPTISMSFTEEVYNFLIIYSFITEGSSIL